MCVQNTSNICQLSLLLAIFDNKPYSWWWETLRAKQQWLIVHTSSLLHLVYTYYCNIIRYGASVYLEERFRQNILMCRNFQRNIGRQDVYWYTSYTQFFKSRYSCYLFCYQTSGFSVNLGPVMTRGNNFVADCKVADQQLGQHINWSNSIDLSFLGNLQTSCMAAGGTKLACKGTYHRHSQGKERLWVIIIIDSQNHDFYKQVHA